MTQGFGHNSGVDSETSKLLREYAERITRLKEEVKGLNDDIKDIKAEAKSRGFDPKQLMKAIALRDEDVAKRKEENEVLRLYALAIGVDPALVSDLF